MKQIIVVVILVLVVSNILNAKKVSLQEVKNIAQNWYTEKYDDPSKFGIEEIHEMKDDDDEAYCYVVNYIDKQGSVYIPAYNTYKRPGFSFGKTGNIDYNRILKFPNKYPIIIKRFKNIIKKIKDNKDSIKLEYIEKRKKFGKLIKSIEEVKQLWKKYNVEPSKFIPSSNMREKDDNLINTLWHQDKPYNLNCPIFIEDDDEIIYNSAGCVAIAFTQIMKYHEFPASNYAIGYNEYTQVQYGTHYANFSTWNFDWSDDNLLLEYIYNDPFHTDPQFTEEQGESISKLCYEFGVSVNMNYNSDGSGSSGTPERVALNSLVKFFNYSGCGPISKLEYSTYNWYEMIKHEIEAQRVVEYSGTFQGDGSHSYVVDGYDDNLGIHVNWGYELTIPEWVELDDDEGSSAIIHILPDYAENNSFPHSSPIAENYSENFNSISNQHMDHSISRYLPLYIMPTYLYTSGSPYLVAEKGVEGSNCLEIMLDNTNAKKNTKDLKEKGGFIIKKMDLQQSYTENPILNFKYSIRSSQPPAFGGEVPVYEIMEYDSIIVSVSNDKRNTWTDIYSVNNSNHINTKEFNNIELDLEEFEGDVVNIRFRFRNDDANPLELYVNYLIDDISLIYGLSSQTPIDFSLNKTNKYLNWQIENPIEADQVHGFNIYQEDKQLNADIIYNYEDKSNYKYSIADEKKEYQLEVLYFNESPKKLKFGR